MAQIMNRLYDCNPECNLGETWKLNCPNISMYSIYLLKLQLALKTLTFIKIEFHVIFSTWNWFKANEVYIQISILVFRLSECLKHCSKFWLNFFEWLQKQLDFVLKLSLQLMQFRFFQLMFSSWYLIRIRCSQVSVWEQKLDLSFELQLPAIYSICIIIDWESLCFIILNYVLLVSVSGFRINWKKNLIDTHQWWTMWNLWYCVFLNQ